MNHLSEEQLILHYYGEEGETLAAELHLEECESCRAVYGSLQRVLNAVDSLPVPVRGPEYGSQVWQRIERRIPRRRPFWAMPAPWRWAGAAVALASLLLVAFLAGRSYPKGRQAGQMAAADSQTRERVLLVAVGDYLERSQTVLIELANANPKESLDITSEQERAADLVSENRLYRQTADHAGNTVVSGVLEELERVLMDIANSPSRMSPAELGSLRDRLKEQGILFKIRVLGSNVKNQKDPAGPVGQPGAGQKL